MTKGLPASIIKKYGVTKKAWAVFRGRHKAKSTPHRVKTVRTKSRSYNMTKRKKHSYRSAALSIAGFAKRVILPAAPHLLSNAGVAGMGYNAFAPGLGIGDRLKLVGANELLLFTGYDALASRWNFTPMAVNYGAVALPKIVGGLVRMLTKRR